MKTLNQQDLRDIVRGACFLASGGGGAYSTGKQIADNFDKSKSVTVYSIEEILKENDNSGPTSYAAVTAVMGAPEKMKEIKDGSLNVLAIKKLAFASGINEKQIKCLVPVEIGALSSAIACVTASELGIPVIDADGAGRAVPKLNMTTFSVEWKCAKINPTVLVAKDDSYIALAVGESATSSSTIELLARPVLDLPQFDGMGAIALWLIDLNDLKQVLPIQNTLSKCLALGQHICTNLEELKDPDLTKMKKVLADIDYEAKIVLDCTLKSAKTSTEGGFDHGLIELQDKKTKELLRIVFQNESLLLWSNEKANPIVLAPDLISYIIPQKEKGQQWIYSNGDIMGIDGKLKKELVDADIKVICMVAPNELKKHHDNLFTLQSAAPTSKGTLYDSYQSMLKELNYYGSGTSSF